MFPNLSEIKLRRKRLDLTQHELALRAGISQSLIAKIEAGTIDPTYSKTRKIFETLDNASKKTRLKAKDIMNKKIISAKPSEKITHIISHMRESNISQLPVVNNNELIGVISESNILDALITGKKDSVEEVMSERPPSVSKDTSVDAISGLLKHFSMVAVFDRHKMIGIITKLDIIDNIV